MSVFVEWVEEKAKHSPPRDDTSTNVGGAVIAEDRNLTGRAVRGKVKAMNKAERSRIAKALGSVGGSVQSRAQRSAAKANLLVANKKRQKYSACPWKAYKNHSHRFNPKTKRCYGCGAERSAALVHD